MPARRGFPVGRRLETPRLRGVQVSPRLLVAVLLASLACYAAIAADVVHTGRLARLDTRIASWVASSMPAPVEWLALPLTWIGGLVGLVVVVTAAGAWLLSRDARAEAVLLVVVALGVQLLVATGKNGYDRPRPDLGSAIALPGSYAFPSGHAAGGIAVFGVLGLLLSSVAHTRRRRMLAISAGFALGALVGASRVVLGVHYVTDVLGGAFLGLAWLVACLLVALRRCR